MSIITEKKKVYGRLCTQFGEFWMLKEFPDKMNVPWYLKDQSVLSFYVIDDGFEKNILVGGNNFLIKPVPYDTEKEASYFVEDKKEGDTES